MRKLLLLLFACSATALQAPSTTTVAQTVTLANFGARQWHGDLPD